MSKKVFLDDMGSGFSEKVNAEIVVLPVPYDGTSTWRKGADRGPFSLLEASSELELYDVETSAEVYRHGIFTMPALKVEGMSPEKMTEKVRSDVEALIDDKKFVVTLGGEHSVSVGAAQAHASRFEDMWVLQLDAHADLREEYMGSRYNHACVMARIREFSPFVQVGIRSMSSTEAGLVSSEDFFPAHEIHKDPGWIEKVIDRIGLNVYVTIDLDVFDPAFLPATGTPQPGGLDWMQVTSLLRKVSAGKNIVGFDVTELCPDPGEKASDMLAAKLVYKLLGYIFVNR